MGGDSNKCANEEMMEIETFTKGIIQRLLYQGHVNLLLDSMGGDSNKCANEEMTEIEICKILSAKSVDFRAIDIKDTEQMKHIIVEKKLFETEGTRGHPTLGQTEVESQIRAFRLLHDVYFIREIRQYMTDHIYISFIGAHRAGKSSLLKSLWHLPARIGDSIHNRTKQMHMYTLKDDAKNNRVHIIDFPGVTDPDAAISQLTCHYSICSSFYVIVVQAHTDYAEVSKLIQQLQTPAMIANYSPSIDPTSDVRGTGFLNRRAPFVVIVTHIDRIVASLKTEIEELAKDRLHIDPELICPCYNEEAIKDENHRNKYKDDHLDGIPHVREFLTKHFNKVFGEDHKFNEYMNYRYEHN